MVRYGQSLGIYVGGLNCPCGPGAENVEPVIVNTGGPPMPRKGVPTQKGIENNFNQLTEMVKNVTIPFFTDTLFSYLYAYEKPKVENMYSPCRYDRNSMFRRQNKFITWRSGLSTWECQFSYDH